MKTKHLCYFLVFVASLVLAASLSAETFGVKKRRPKPHEYGNVVINNFSEQNDIAPVVFRHWLHRAKYTCRLCHVDIGFAMRAEETEITEDDIRNGLYCGACHNGKEAFPPQEKKIIGSGMTKHCDRCHSYGKSVTMENDFYSFRKSFKRERFGNGIDWLDAEERQLVTLKDYLEGISISRRKLKEPEEFELNAKEPNMPDIIFSHKKHAVWSGCELCHPDIFAGVRKGAVKYSMLDIFNGRYCGACHGIVAFPNYDCQRCHTKQVF